MALMFFRGLGKTLHKKNLSICASTAPELHSGSAQHASDWKGAGFCSMEEIISCPYSAWLRECQQLIADAHSRGGQDPRHRRLGQERGA